MRQEPAKLSTVEQSANEGEVELNVVDSAPKSYALSAAAPAPMYAPPRAGMQPVQSHAISSAPWSVADSMYSSVEGHLAMTAEMPEGVALTLEGSGAKGIQPQVVVSAPLSAAPAMAVVPVIGELMGARSGFDVMEWKSRPPLCVEVGRDQSAGSPQMKSSMDGSSVNIIMSMIFVLIFAALYLGADKFITGMVLLVAYAIYMLEVLASDTLKQLSRIQDVSQLEAYRQPPRLWWELLHFRVYSTWKNVTSMGPNYSASHSKVEVKHRENMSLVRGKFVYNVWCDASPTFAEVFKHSQNSVVCAKIGLKTQFGDEFTAQEFERQKKEFCAKNFKGGDYEMAERVHFDGVNDEVMVATDPSQRPVCMSKRSFLITSALGLSCCFRFCFWARIGKVHYHLHKRVFAVAGDSQQIAQRDFTELTCKSVKYTPPQPPANFDTNASQLSTTRSDVRTRSDLATRSHLKPSLG